MIVIWNHHLSFRHQKNVFETTKFSMVVPCFWSLSSSHSSPTVRPKPCGSTGCSSKISSHINHVVQMRRSLWYAWYKTNEIYSILQFSTEKTGSDGFQHGIYFRRLMCIIQNWLEQSRTVRNTRQTSKFTLAATVRTAILRKTCFAGPGQQKYPHEHLGL
jgi:hypothetical protein